MKLSKLFAAITALVASLSVAAIAFSASIPLRSGPVDSGNIRGELNSIIGAINSGVVNKLYANGLVSATSAGTSEETLYTYTLPANSLANVGDSVRIRCGATTAANANNKTFKIYFGASSFSSGTVASNNGAFNFEMIVTRTAAATQMVWSSGTGGTAGITPILPTYTAGADDLTTALVIKCTGQDGSASAADISGKFMLVEMIN